MTPSVEQEIRTLRSLFWSQRDPEGRAFAPLADAYRRAGDFRQAVELLRDGLDRHPDFLSGHVVAAQLYLEKGLLEEAEIAGRRALVLDHENVIAAGIVAEAVAAKRARDGDVEAPSPRAARSAPAPAPVEEPAPLEEPALELTAEEPTQELAALAPEEPVLEMAALAPEVDIAELAPDEPELDVVDIVELAPDEPELDVVDIVELAPDEPVLEMAALAPDEPVLDVVDIADLAPDEPVLEMAALAPEPEPAAEPIEVVGELAGLAPGEGDLPTDELPEEEPLVTRTMAELYARQGLNDRALDVYRQLLEVAPGDAELRRRAEELEAMSIPESHDVDTPFAWTGEEEAPEPPAAGSSISTYFERLLGWTPGSPAAPDQAPPSGGES